MKKRAVKKFVAAVTVMAVAVGMMNMSVQANAESVSAATQDETDGIMPLYERRAIISWADCEGSEFYGGTRIVQSTPVKVEYYSCLKGAAEVRVYVNDHHKQTITIPAYANQTQQVPITCAKGDRITFEVSPKYGYAVTTGDFTLYY